MRSDCVPCLSVLSPFQSCTSCKAPAAHQRHLTVCSFRGHHHPLISPGVTSHCAVVCLQVMSAAIVLGGVAVEVYRLIHDNTALDWRGPPIAAVTALCMGVLAGLALRAANNFKMLSVSDNSACEPSALSMALPLLMWGCEYGLMPRLCAVRSAVVPVPVCGVRWRRGTDPGEIPALQHPHSWCTGA